MHLLKTIDLPTGKFYFSKFYGVKAQIKDQLDPEKQFKLKTADDGTVSILTQLVNSYGDQMSFDLAFNAFCEANSKNSRFIDLRNPADSTVIPEEVIEDLAKQNKIEVVEELPEEVTEETENSVEEMSTDAVPTKKSDSKKQAAKK